MNIRIKLGVNGDDDIVVLPDRSRWMWSAWLKRTEQAVKAVRAAFNSNTITPEAIAGRAWLVRCGVTERPQFEDLERHLPQLRLPADRTNTQRCVRCGSRIWGRQALLTGLGSRCRTARRSAVRAMPSPRVTREHPAIYPFTRACAA